MNNIIFRNTRVRGDYKLKICVETMRTFKIFKNKIFLLLNLKDFKSLSVNVKDVE